MRRLYAVAMLFGVVGMGPMVLTGCGEEGDAVMEYDEKVSEEKRTDYEQQMREAMQQQGRPVAAPQEGSSGTP